MRILKSFDTKIDAEEFVEAVNKYWEWNVILIKRHRIKLIAPLFLVFISMILEWVMLYSIYMHLFDEHKVIFWILAIFYAYTTYSRCIYTIVWIIANIVYWMNTKKKYIDKVYKAEEKQKWFEKFMKRTFVTFFFHTLVLIFNATFPFIIIHTTWLWNLAVAIWILSIDFIFLFLLNRVMYRLMEYEMNFDICTKDSFTAYSQQGFFNTKTMNISTPAIRVIQDSKEWLAWALLQYWNIFIHTDGDLDAKWWKTLELHYIPDPKRLAKKLNSIIEESRGTLS